MPEDAPHPTPSQKVLVRSSLEGPVGILSLCHPPVNILSTEVLDAFAHGIDQLTGNPEARVLVLRSDCEKAFSAGANIREMAEMDSRMAGEHSRKGQALTNLLEFNPLPVIASVHGYCLGGGCEVALACDFVLAAEDAVFGQPEINIGVLPGWGGSRRLTRAIGPARAREWIYTGKTMEATRARDEGWVLHVVPRADLDRETMELARTLAQKPVTALAAAKQAVQFAADPERRKGLEYETSLWAALFSTPDQKEGMRAFQAKKPPRYGARSRELSHDFGLLHRERWDAFQEARKAFRLPEMRPP